MAWFNFLTAPEVEVAYILVTFEESYGIIVKRQCALNLWISRALFLAQPMTLELLDGSYGLLLSNLCPTGKRTIEHITMNNQYATARS